MLAADMLLATCTPVFVGSRTDFKVAGRVELVLSAVEFQTALS
jgi:hypothetical protein